MTTSETAVRPATTIRYIHASMITGIVLFALVVHFLIRPTKAGESLPPTILNVLLGVSLAASALSLLLMRGIPRRNTDESADLYWTTAAAPALRTWMPLEAGGILGVVGYMLDGSAAALVVAAVAVAGMIVLNPGRFERA